MDLRLPGRCLVAFTDQSRRRPYDPKDDVGGGPATATAPAPHPWSGNPLFDPGMKPDQAANAALQQGFNEATRIGGVEEQRGQEAEDIIRQAGDAANKPTISEQDISRMFGQVSDTSGNEFMGHLQNLRSMLGESGITGGGYAAGIAASLEASRLNANVGGMTSVLLKKSAADAQDRYNVYQRQGDLAKQVQRDPSMAFSDFLQQLTGVRLAQQEISANDAASKRAAHATEQAGKMSMIGQLGGGLIGAI